MANTGVQMADAGLQMANAGLKKLEYGATFMCLVMETWHVVIPVDRFHAVCLDNSCESQLLHPKRIHINKQTNK